MKISQAHQSSPPIWWQDGRITLHLAGLQSPEGIDNEILASAMVSKQLNQR